MPESTDNDRSRAASAWLLLGGVQTMMATAIAVWLLANGKLLPGLLILAVAVAIILAVRWKRARLKAQP